MYKNLNVIFLCLFIFNNLLMSMQIYVHVNSDNSTITLDVEPTDIIQNIKSQIQDQISISPESQYLYFNSILLENNRTMADYNIQKNGTIELYSEILPVEISIFTIKKYDNQVILNWQTATEINNSKFEIERLVNSNTKGSISQPFTTSNNWIKIGEVAGYGNSNSQKTYIYTDSKTTYGEYSYRLKQIDNDGKFIYSNTLTIVVNDNLSNNEFELCRNYPNPFNPSTVINYVIPEEGSNGCFTVLLKVYDVLGREVETLVNQKQEAGNYSVRFNASKLSSGMYIAKLNVGGFTRIIKMNLLK